MKLHLVRFFADKDQKFHERVIINLPERWKKIIEQTGKYIIDQSSFLVFKKMCQLSARKTTPTRLTFGVRRTKNVSSL